MIHWVFDVSFVTFIMEKHCCYYFVDSVTAKATQIAFALTIIYVYFLASAKKASFNWCHIINSPPHATDLWICSGTS